MIAQPDRFAFVKEGFCWPALFIPLLWIVYRRLWLVLAAYLAVVMASSALFALLSLSDIAQTAMGFAFNLVFAFFANDLRRWTLKRHGFGLIAVVFASRLDEAERRFFHDLLLNLDAEAPASRPTPPASAAASFAGEPVVGLFPAPAPGPGS